VFVTAAAGSALLHLNLKATRRLVASSLDDGLAGAFQGKMSFGAIDRIALDGVDVAAVTMRDPRGAEVLSAARLHVAMDARSLARDAIFGDGELVVRVRDISIGDADVVIEPGPNGTMTIADAFTPPIPPTPPPTPPPPGRPARVLLDHIAIEHAHVHGALFGEGPQSPGDSGHRALDAQLSKLTAHLEAGAEGVKLEVPTASIVESSILPGAPIDVGATFGAKIGLEGVRLDATVLGKVGAIDVDVAASMDGDDVRGHVKIGTATPEAVSKIAPGYPVRRPARASLEIAGPLAQLEVRAVVDIAAEGNVAEGHGEIDARVAISKSGPAIDAQVLARAIDPSAFAPDVPLSPIDAEGRVRMRFDEGQPVVIAEARAGALTLAKQPIPASDVTVIVARGLVLGTVSAHETGLPIEGSFSASAKEGVRFQATTEAASLSAAPRLRGMVSGRARASVAGTFREGQLDARVKSSFDGLSTKQGQTFDHGTLEGRVSGKPDALHVDATVRGDDLHAGPYQFNHVDARVSGPPSALHITAKTTGGTLDQLDASASLDARSASVRAIKVHAARGDSAIDGTIDRIGAAPSGVAIEGLALRGNDIGDLHGTLRIEGKELVGKLRGEGVDLARIADLTGLPTRVKGLADIDVDLERTAHGRKGHVQIAFENGEASLLHGLSGQLAVGFDDRAMQVDGMVRLIESGDASSAKDDCQGAIAEVRVERGEAILEGGLLDPKTWSAIAGSARVTAPSWDLRCLSRLVPIRLVLSDLQGKLDARAVISRAQGQRLPSIDALELHTRGLQVAGAESLGDDAPPWESRGINLDAGGSIDASTGRVKLNATVHDGAPLVEADVTTTLDLQALLDDPKRRMDRLRAADLDAHVHVPQRPFAAFGSLPTFLRERLPPLDGAIEAWLTIAGSALAPRAAAKVRAWSITHNAGGTQGSPWALPVDTTAFATYDGATVLTRAALEHEKRTIASMTGTAELPWSSVLAGAPTWAADLDATLFDVPIGELPFFSDREIGGHVGGKIVVSGINRAPAIDVTLALPDLRLGQDLFFEDSSLTLHAGRAKEVDGEQRADATAAVDLRTQDGGRLRANGYSGVVYKGLLPAPDGDAHAEVSVVAERFRLQGVQPFLAGAVSRLDGVLDGHLRMWKRAMEDSATNLDAEMTIANGILNVPQVGQELHNMRLKIRSKSSELMLDEIAADGVRGHILGKGVVHLRGIGFKDAHVDLSIPDDDALPITLEGVPFGDARGNVGLDMKLEDRTLVVDLNLSNDLALPPQTGRATQRLEANPDVTISHHVAAPTEQRAADALGLRVNVTISKLVLQGRGIWVSLGTGASPPRIEVTNTLHAQGDVLVQSGHFTVLGKQFTIDAHDGSLVHLRDEEPANPFLNVTAHWDAPDGTRIFVDYVGVLFPVTNDKLRFRSSGDLTQQQIFGALLFGAEVDQGALAGAASGGPSAQQAAGGLIAQQFNSMLAGISPAGGLSTRFDTAEDGSLQTSVTYQLGDKVRAEATFEGAGNSAGGTANNRARTQIAVDWNFRPAWTAHFKAGVGGDQPTSGVDLLWQYRY
jgi:translocation and assembly module TamB